MPTEYIYRVHIFKAPADNFFLEANSSSDYYLFKIMKIQII